MPITQSMNSKANVKKFTNNDLPFSAQQPVINSYYADSTLGQTVINYGFSIDMSNKDVFFLFVDGKKLREGSANDYQFTSVGSDGTSQQVTLNQSLPAGLNIQAFKLGLKSESEFLMDNRFSQLYDAQSEGFQGFVKTSTLMTPTSVAGTPAAGTFYSSITNRAPLPDLAQDLGARMGIERIMLQNISPIHNEFGPNGETVWADVNDSLGRIRFVGSQWVTALNTWGNLVDGPAAGNYVEVTFYGTGLNWVTYPNEQAGTDVRASVDGGAEGADIAIQQNALIGNRGYQANIVVPIFSGLTLGVHTVRLRLAVAANALNCFGFEILNESGQIKVNPGVGFTQGKKYTSASQSAFAYNEMATGVRGGRAVIYQNGDGTIGKAWQAVNASQQNLTAADHTNEEVARVYQWREFGANRADDFSTLTSASSSRAFTLGDGVTTLVGNTIDNGSVEAVGTSLVNGFYTLTFVGTGLDIVVNIATAGLSASQTISVDGTAILTSTQINSTVTGNNVIKIVSGLPYGTHTVKILKTVSNGVWDFRAKSFIVYQPKKPAIPSGTVELADYNVMADYVATGVATKDFVGNGILRKMAAVRETTFTGTWNANLIDASPTNFDSGFSANTATSGSTWRYTFFGTGLEIGTFFQAVAYNQTISVDGSTDLSGFTTSLTQPGSGLTLTAAAGTITGTSVGAGRGRIRISNMSLGLHTIIVTTNNTALSYIDTWDIITPIYAQKSNFYANIQNALPVGSNSLCDSRKYSPIEDAILGQKAYAVAYGNSSAPTSSVTTLLPMPDMSVTINTTGGALDISYALPFSNSVGASPMINCAVFIDGVQVEFPSNFAGNTTANMIFHISNRMIIPVSAGTHKVDLFWMAPAGVVTAQGNKRILVVKEI